MAHLLQVAWTQQQEPWEQEQQEAAQQLEQEEAKRQLEQPHPSLRRLACQVAMCPHLTSHLVDLLSQPLRPHSMVHHPPPLLPGSSFRGNGRNMVARCQAAPDRTGTD